jgi:glycosyltransferase involved in cell wall biosynthesis
VVFVESASAMGGVQFSTLYLAERLNKAVWEPLVVCPRAGELVEACREAGIETRVLNQPRLWSTSIRLGRNIRVPNPAAWLWDSFVLDGATRRLRKLLREIDADVIVTKGLLAHFAGGIAARRLGIPCVWHVQDFISERTSGIYRKLFGIAARWLPQQIIADGNTIKNQLPKSLWPRIDVIHNGINTDVFYPGVDGTAIRRELEIPEGHLVVGHVGRITPWKGQHFLIQAFAEIANENSSSTLLIVGAPVFDNDLYQRRLLNMVSKLGLQGRVKFTGYRHDLPRVLAAMDVFAFTSTEKDTSPLALLSAMSCGLPIVAFDIAGVRELMDTEDQFHLVPVGDIDELQHVLSSLIADETMRQRLSESARKLATDKFNLDRNTTRIEKVLCEILQAGARDTREIVKPSTAELPDCI